MKKRQTSKPGMLFEEQGYQSRPQQTSIQSFFVSAKKEKRKKPSNDRTNKPRNKESADGKRINNSTTDNKKKKQQRRTTTTTQQLYLDLGQATFAKQVECPFCHMLYVHGVQEDERRHRKICQTYTLGVPFQFAKSTLCVRREWDVKPPLLPIPRRTTTTTAPTRTTAWIVKIRPTDRLALRNKVAQVQSIVQQELGFVQDDEDSAKKKKRFTYYLCIVQQRIVGLLVTEPIPHAYPLLETTKGCYERSTVSVPAQLGIFQMWVHQQYRGCGLCRALVDVARQERFANHGMISQHLVAFSSPTQAGIQFALRYCRPNDTPSSPSTIGTLEEENSIQETEDPAAKTSVLVYDCSIAG